VEGVNRSVYFFIFLSLEGMLICYASEYRTRLVRTDQPTQASVTQPIMLIYNFFTDQLGQGHLLTLLLAPTRRVHVELLLCTTHCHVPTDSLRRYAEGELPHYLLPYVII